MWCSVIQCVSVCFNTNRAMVQCVVVHTGTHKRVRESEERNGVAGEGRVGGGVMGCFLHFACANVASDEGAGICVESKSERERKGGVGR